MAELAGQSWAPTAMINVIVRDGVVELWGTIADERERAAIIVAAENAPGVKGVNDHLVWVDALSDLLFCLSDGGSGPGEGILTATSCSGRPAFGWRRTLNDPAPWLSGKADLIGIFAHDRDQDQCGFGDFLTCVSAPVGLDWRPVRSRSSMTRA